MPKAGANCEPHQSQNGLTSDARKLYDLLAAEIVKLAR
jgi:hypothetical protein